MDPNEMPAVPCCPSDSPTGLETGAPWGIELGPKRTVSRCARCYNHGLDDQIKDQEHSCPFQACECHKCAFFSDPCRVRPAESALKRDHGACLNWPLTQELITSGTSPQKAHGHVQKLTIQGGVVSKHPRRSPDSSGPKISVSTLESSRLEEATDNFFFQEDPQDHCPVQHGPEASDQDSVSASSEWQRKLEAAEALLMLRNSSQASSGSIPLLQPFMAAGKHPRRSPDWSGPKISVSTLDSSSLEDATDNFFFQEDPQHHCPVQHGPEASDQDSVSASSEWQRKLEAAEALLMLRNSSQASSGSIPLLQPFMAAGKHPRKSPDWSGPKISVSTLDSSSLEDATDNFFFQEDPQHHCPVQHGPEASDQDSVSASSEWQRKLEAAEALLMLRNSSQASSGSIPPLQPFMAAGKHPRRSPDWSGPKISVSTLDSSSLEDATDNFFFQEDPQHHCPVQRGPEASDQDSVSASSEWQRKLEAAEALLMLRNSSQASSGSIPPLQPFMAAGKHPRRSPDWSGPKISVSTLDSSSLEDATDNFFFQEDPQHHCPVQRGPEASDQDSVSASSEWQRKLEAAEALLMLRNSSQASSGSIPPLQPFMAAGKHPRRSPDWSGPKISVSTLDSSSLEDATDNFFFQEDPQHHCPVQRGPEASDQDSVSASSEWQRKLEAAEALLMLRNSSQASSGSIPPLQPFMAAGKHPRRSPDWSGPKISVSTLDSSSLEDATDNFFFQEDPQHHCPVQHGPEASDQDSVSASSEWQRKLEAAEALLMLRNSSQASSVSIPPAPAFHGSSSSLLALLSNPGLADQFLCLLDIWSASPS